MRSSKQRSRSKTNRNRQVGNIVNRVFDSSGPEGKVRGTPQQIIDKYNQLARDAQLSNDRVAAENFQQHSEHYTRMLGDALREAESRREQQDGQNGNQNQNNNQNQNGNQNGNGQQGGNDRNRDDRNRDDPRSNGGRDDNRQSGRDDGRAAQTSPDSRDDGHRTEPPRRRAENRSERAEDTLVLDAPEGVDSGLVDTPEGKADLAPRRAAPDDQAARTPDDDAGGGAKPDATDQTAAADDTPPPPPPPRKARAPRKPRAPKADKRSEASADAGGSDQDPAPGAPDRAAE